ncbi:MULTISPECIES: serine protease [unclassified Massilia]|uniref:S1 family peptidase n=1 Tax=unclassified Massilia TaxID=2609279 RepID=UPI00177F83AC|nr:MULTISPECIES: serine protease [unclassified Massilia]MBD8532464.1 trypsin-like peptidase domain-containing protein [Massilia sp. CFBP 13647]MBD8675834.1 trypsin-like peptidase domain-containing protein [Massilia sp. CFBP 13721]
MKFIASLLLSCCFGAAHAAHAAAPASAARGQLPAGPAAKELPAPPLAVPPATPPGTTPPAPGPGELDTTTTLPPPSSAAQQLYSAAQADLLQIRMLLRNGRTQSTVGSGFLVGTSNLVLTNYHVVSQMALDPEVYAGEYVDTDGQRGPVELLAVDVLHDLAVLRVNRNGSGFFSVPDKAVKLTQGQYLYSLGNPLDLGFAISEGAYNGVVSRSFYDQLIFSGPINSGMSGGPSVTSSGTVAGINVSKRRDGEAVSFLVPVKYAQQLLRQVAGQRTVPKDFNPLIAEQLLAHQRAMVGRLLDTPFSIKNMGPYLVPVRESGQVRCWGRSNVMAEASFSSDTLSCAMESAIYVSDNQQTGQVSMTHQYLRTANLHPLRFAALASSQFGLDRLGNTRDARLTGPLCSERFVHSNTLPLRAVTCVRAYRKFPGLYNFTLLTASTDNPQASLQSRLDVAGVSYENGMRVARAFLYALGRTGKL